MVQGGSRRARIATEIGAHRVPSTENGSKMKPSTFWAAVSCGLAVSLAACITQLALQEPEVVTETVVQTHIVSKPVPEVVHAQRVRTEVKKVVNTVTEIKEVPVEVPVYVTDEAAMNAQYISGYEDGRIEGEDWQSSHYEVALSTPCATEDSDNCYWLASSMGNGEGRSFVVIFGTTYYLD